MSVRPVEVTYDEGIAALRDPATAYIPAMMIFCVCVEAQERMTRDDDKIRVVGVGRVEESPLQRFAGWFHQDWALLFPDFFEGTRMYVSQLSPMERSQLRAELMMFLEREGAKEESEIRNAWFQLGAQAWQPNLEIVESLRKFTQMM